MLISAVLLELFIDIQELLNAETVSMELKKNGLLAKNIRDHILRFSPPLCITEEQLRAGIDILVNTINTMPTKK